MPNFKKDRALLLKALHDIVTEEMDNSKLNVYLEEDVAEFLTEVTDKRRQRRLRLIQRELGNWIRELKDSTKKETNDKIPVGV